MRGHQRSPVIPWLDGDEPFPDPRLALAEPNGLLAAGADLSVERLTAAYSLGIFPWFNRGEPILWWSPSPRMVMFPKEFKPSRSLRKTLRNRDYEVRVDTAFANVMDGCAVPRDGQGGTWIVPAVKRAYLALHHEGVAHSFETWVGDELMGGLYGVALGRVFFGESMFARCTDASKIAFAHLVATLDLWQFGLIDCQMRTRHLESLGGREIPRDEFQQHVAELTRSPSLPGYWHLPDAAARDRPWVIPAP